MSLPRAVLHRSLPHAQVATRSGHTCLTPGNSSDIQHTHAAGRASFSALIRCSALALCVHSHLAARPQAWVAETDSAANHYGQLRAENPRHHLRFLWPVSAPRILSDLWIGERL